VITVTSLVREDRLGCQRGLGHAARVDEMMRSGWGPKHRLGITAGLAEIVRYLSLLPSLRSRMMSACKLAAAF